MEKYSTDRLMFRLGQKLCSDFKSVYGPTLVNGMDRVTSPYQYRYLRWPGRSSLPPGPFKAQYQLENIFKRYRFNDDIYSPSELLDMSMEKFMDTQCRIGRPSVLRTALTHPVIQRARCIARDILGEYDVMEHVALCKFGSKSSVGNTLRNSYLDEKINKGGPVSGSVEHIAWFKKYADPAIVAWIGEGFTPCVSLPLVFVPKSHKALRSIMPNTTLGGFYSYGLGMVIQKRLTSVGLDIPRLQDKHRRLIKGFSMDRSHATADLSAASDSFRSDLVNMLLPRKWYNVVKLGRLANFNLGKRSEVYALSSFMTMGIGFTFQLQTLLFYCLLRAIKDLLALKGRVSVYGDDLIYPTRMHEHVRVVLEKLLFQLNLDKTYVHDHFRESCGSDCCRGVDVRPFQPLGEAQDLARLPYLSLLYKTANGLLLRWSKEEIPLTFRFLILEMTRVTDKIHIVPLHFPDTSGLKTPSPKDLVDEYVEQHIPIFDANLQNAKSKIFGYTFEYLALKPRQRITTQHWVYLWNYLRGASCNEFERSYSIYDTGRDVLTWKNHRDIRQRVKTKWGKWTSYERRLIPFLPERSSLLKVVYQTGSVSNWSDVMA